MKLSGEGRVRGLWSLVFVGGFDIEIVALHRCVFECGGGGASMVVRGYWWGLGIGRLVWDCDYAAVALGFARGGVWLQVRSTGLRHSLPLVDLWRGGGGFLGLCVFHLQVGFLSVPLVALSTVVRSFP